jgi:hypothetical protein
MPCGKMTPPFIRLKAIAAYALSGLGGGGRNTFHRTLPCACLKGVALKLTTLSSGENRGCIGLLLKNSIFASITK